MNLGRQLASLQRLAPDASHLVELIVLIGANGLATVFRFVVLRSWIARGREPRPVIITEGSLP